MNKKELETVKKLCTATNVLLENLYDNDDLEDANGDFRKDISDIENALAAINLLTKGK